MRRQGFAFEFELPDGWADDSGGGRVIAHGPGGEELIVSGAVIMGIASGDGTPSPRAGLLRNAFEAVRYAADVPELRVTKPLGQETTPHGLEGWTTRAETTDGEVAFLQSVVASEVAVLIGTLEGPNTEATDQAFQGFLQTIRRASTH